MSVEAHLSVSLHSRRIRGSRSLVVWIREESECTSLYGMGRMRYRLEGGGWEAACRTLSAASTAAFKSRSSRTAALCPPTQASISGVRPFCDIANIQSSSPRDQVKKDKGIAHSPLIDSGHGSSEVPAFFIASKPCFHLERGHSRRQRKRLGYGWPGLAVSAGRAGIQTKRFYEHIDGQTEWSYHLVLGIMRGFRGQKQSYHAFITAPRST